MKFRHFLLCIGLISACSKEEVTVPAEEIPEVRTRSFYMGFTGFPYDLTEASQIDTYEQVAANGDIFLNHLDYGVPWDEALNDLPFPEEVQNTLEITRTGLKPGTKVLLTATPTSQDRKTLARYWNNEGSHQDLPANWENKSMDDPEVIAAYINYCKRINEIQPDYFAYGIETNATFRKEDGAFTEFLFLADTVYTTLKSTFPDLPVFLTIQNQSFENTREELLETSELLLEHSDYIAMSSYPFLNYANLQQDANPALLENDWLQDFRDLDISKPFAISETGFCAEDLIIENLGVNVKASEVWQADFVDKLLGSADALEAEFVVWFVYRDYDAMYEKTQNPPDILKIWRDNGLLDGAGNQRPAYARWQEWKALQRR